MRDLYAILGVSDRANSAEIKAAYRLLAKLSHPDLHLGDEEAGRRIQDINYAYGILSDPEARAAYDFKLMIPRIWARRRRRAAVAAIGLAAFMVSVTTFSITWRRHSESPPMASNEVKPQSGPLASGNQTVEVSAEGRPDLPSAAAPVHEAGPSAGRASNPPPETPGDLRKSAGTELAAVPPSAFPSEPLAATPHEPIERPGPQSVPASAVPFEPPARQVASAGEIARPPGAQRDSSGDRPAQGRILRKPGEGGRVIKFARTTLQTAQRESGQEPRLVSSSATALRWPSADEPFVNMGARGR
jgi:hypothetical protein